MDNKKILEKAIDKALSSGLILHFTAFPGPIKGIDIVMSCSYDQLFRIIFSHDFAKAFWGEEDQREVDGAKLDDMGDCTYYTLKEWQYHLQQMVLEENPVKYLEQFI